LTIKTLPCNKDCRVVFVPSNPPVKSTPVDRRWALDIVEQYLGDHKGKQVIISLSTWEE